MRLRWPELLSKQPPGIRLQPVSDRRGSLQPDHMTETGFSFQEDLKAWTSNITICIAEHKAMKKWDKPDVSSLDPEHSERKEKSEGDADARSERSEQALGDERSDRGDRSEKLDTSEIADRMEGGAGESSTSLKSK